MFNKVLIANRGEIALRIQRTCRELGIFNVCVFSEADRNAKYVKLADEAICIGPADPEKSYLDQVALISAAEVSGADAIHPGYGFLSENADFAEKVEGSGFVFVGPRPETIRTMGDKLQAKKVAGKAGLKMIPGFDIKDDMSPEELSKEAKKIGYPLMIKAAAGGGGRGMKVVHTESMFRNSIGVLARETERAFGDGSLYAEKLVVSARHVEVQVLGDNHGNMIHLGTRDCSVQRRHQKLIEEAPPPGISPKALDKIANRSVEACKKVGYVGAGTIEFLYDGRDFYFIEMNTRIQVEHPVTEILSGVDIVEEQLRVAADERLSIKQKDISLDGHAIECRINAEDSVSFTPSPGRISAYHPAGGPGIRIDSHAFTDCEIPHYYDSLIGKVITYGSDRKQALRRMKRALSEMVITGVKTNIPLHLRILETTDFANGGVPIDFLELTEMSRSENVSYLTTDKPAFCLEGGGTHSRGALYMPGNEEAVAKAHSGVCNPSNDFSVSVASALDIWEQISACSSIKRSEAVAVLGVAGLNPDDVRSKFVEALGDFDQVVPLSDGYAALVGSGGGNPCGMIVAGTGCAGHRLRPDGTSFQRDGWGWIGGDRGSGAWIGLRAIRHATVVRDGLAESDKLDERVLEKLGGSDSNITHWLQSSTPKDIADCAKLVFASAEEGLSRANEILDAAAAHLRDLFNSLGCAPGEPLYLSGTIAEALLDRIAQGMDTQPTATKGMALEGCRLVSIGKAPIEWER